MELLCEVIRNMTSAETIELHVSRLNKSQDIKVLNELVALQAVNPALKKIDLWLAGSRSSEKLS